MRWLFFALPVLACHSASPPAPPPTDLPYHAARKHLPHTTAVGRIGQIPVPAGYQRVLYPASHMATWLQQLPLHPPGTPVRLHNGQVKSFQNGHHAVLRLPIGNENLLQCADAAMYLRARYLYEKQPGTSIHFTDNTGKRHVLPPNATQRAFQQYLRQVYSYCNTASLERDVTAIGYAQLQPGDLLLRGGFPGHAAVVADMCVNEKGDKLYLLLQGYMPAQDLHVLKNPMNDDLSPWYQLLPQAASITTPGYRFTPADARRFK